jgi:hypothetical protein
LGKAWDAKFLGNREIRLNKSENPTILKLLRAKNSQQNLQAKAQCPARKIKPKIDFLAWYSLQHLATVVRISKGAPQSSCNPFR